LLKQHPKNLYLSAPSRSKTIPLNRFLTCCLFLLTFSYSSAQKKNASFQYHIQKASSPISIDGIADEQAWKDAQVATDFYMVLPMDTSAAGVRTDVSMTYDGNNVYLLAVCYNPPGTRLMVESLRRDFAFLKNDNFLVF